MSQTTVKYQFIDQFGRYDYARLEDMGNPERLSLIPDDLKDVAELLNKLIKEKRILIMDMENCVMFKADGLFGADGNKLLIISPR